MWAGFPNSFNTAGSSKNGNLTVFTDIEILIFWTTFMD